MTQQHPITPPPDKIHNWIQLEKIGWSIEQIITFAAQWGADQELEACIEVIADYGWFANPVHRIAELRVARRPKPPSLKEEALLKLKELQALLQFENVDSSCIRRALESIPDPS